MPPISVILLNEKSKSSCSKFYNSFKLLKNSVKSFILVLLKKYILMIYESEILK